jgi:hypothetical protein
MCYTNVEERENKMKDFGLYVYYDPYGNDIYILYPSDIPYYPGARRFNKLGKLL